MRGKRKSRIHAGRNGQTSTDNQTESIEPDRSIEPEVPLISSERSGGNDAGRPGKPKDRLEPRGFGHREQSSDIPLTPILERTGEAPMPLQSFPPVIDESSLMLVLGSMPGEASLVKRQYYGHPRNHFWPILYNLFGDGVPSDRYEEKLQFALRHRVALWDVLAECEREGSLDAAIRQPVANDFNSLLASYPNVKVLLFNGSAAAKLFAKHAAVSPDITRRIRTTALPSTSPANTQPFAAKLEAWRAAFQSAACTVRSVEQ